MVDSIRAGNNAVTADDIGFHFLVQALDEGGASEMIYDMNNRDDIAGYGFQLKKGATALTESWQALEEVSNNHLMLGHIMEWFYSGLAGIAQQESSIAYRHIKIRPQPVGNINFAEGTYYSPYGWIRTKRTKKNNKFSLNVELPVNTDAQIYVPATTTSKIYKNERLVNGAALKDGMAIISIGSGRYNIEVEN